MTKKSWAVSLNMSKLPKTALNLKQFLVRQEVISLYRDILRTIRNVPDESSRLELYEWARSDFRKNKEQSDDLAIKTLLNHGKKSLQNLQNNLALSK